MCLVGKPATEVLDAIHSRLDVLEGFGLGRGERLGPGPVVVDGDQRRPRLARRADGFLAALGMTDVAAATRPRGDGGWPRVARWG